VSTIGAPRPVRHALEVQRTLLHARQRRDPDHAVVGATRELARAEVLEHGETGEIGDGQRRRGARAASAGRGDLETSGRSAGGKTHLHLQVTIGDEQQLARLHIRVAQARLREPARQFGFELELARGPFELEFPRLVGRRRQALAPRAPRIERTPANGGRRGGLECPGENDPHALRVFERFTRAFARGSRDFTPGSLRAARGLSLLGREHLDRRKRHAGAGFVGGPSEPQRGGAGEQQREARGELRARTERDERLDRRDPERERREPVEPVLVALGLQALAQLLERTREP
jgi:hypothetical protein